LTLLLPAKAVALTTALFISLLVVPSDAQGRRFARAVPGRVVVLRAYYTPFFYDPWYSPYGWYPPFAYASGYPADSSLRLEVSPEQTEVFVDGYYAGTVDDFDGFFQRLHLEPGEHDIELYLQGYRTAREKVYLQPSGTFRIRHTMEALPPGQAPEPRPATAAPPPRGPNPPPEPDAARRAPPQSDAGTLAIRVQPGNADVLIDGERWAGPAADEQLIVEVVAGAHLIEVRRDGYRTYAAEVDVRRGETTTLNVSLSRQ
jgi:hypothetical protein